MLLGKPLFDLENRRTWNPTEDLSRRVGLVQSGDETSSTSFNSGEGPNKGKKGDREIRDIKGGIRQRKLSAGVERDRLREGISKQQKGSQRRRLAPSGSQLRDEGAAVFQRSCKETSVN